MNISDFIITVTVSLLTGISIGLVLVRAWTLLLSLIATITKKPKVLKSVNFTEFFSIESRN